MKLEAAWMEYGRVHVSDCWENFRRGSTFSGPTERAERLAEWGAVWIEDNETWCRYIEFENEEDATVFILRWS